jgi:hypothetical protein
MHMAETNVDIDALIADFAQRSLQVGAERRKAVAEVVAFFDVADVNSIERFILGYCDGAEEPELSLFCELLGGHIVSRNRVEPLKALLRAARTNWFVRRSLVYGFPFHTSLTGRDSAALGELEKLASSDTTLGPERLAQAWIRGNDPDGVFRNDYIVGQIVGDVDDLIRSTDLDGIERFLVAACRDLEDERLAHFGAGAPEDIVNHFHPGNLAPLKALLAAAQESVPVRKAIGFAWFSPNITDPEAQALFEQIKALAIHVEG